MKTAEAVAWRVLTWAAFFGGVFCVSRGAWLSWLLCAAVIIASTRRW